MFQHIVTAWRIDRGCSRMLEHAKSDLIQQPSSWLYHTAVHHCDIAVQFITIDGFTLFKSFCPSSHEQSVPTCINKPVNNTVQASQPPTMFKLGS